MTIIDIFMHTHEMYTPRMFHYCTAVIKRMELRVITALFMKYISWISFQLVRNTSADYNAFLNIKARENIGLFDLEELNGYRCGTQNNGVYRDENIDTVKGTGCPKEVWVCLPDCGTMTYIIRLDVTNPLGSLSTWMNSNPLHPPGTSFSLSENGFDFLVNKSSSLTQAAVYNSGPPNDRPRIFAIPLASGGGEPIGNLPIFNSGKVTQFKEFAELQVKYVFVDACTKPTQFITSTTCQEAFEDAKKTTTDEPTTTTKQQTTTTKQTTSPTTTTTTSPTTTTTTSPTTTSPTTTEATTRIPTSAEMTTSMMKTTSQEMTTKEEIGTGISDTTLAYVTTTYANGTTGSKPPMCPCDCDYYAKVKYWERVTVQNLTQEELIKILQPEMQATKKQLTVNRSELSSFRYKKISASDDRASSKSIGVVSAVFMCMVIGSLIVCDFMSIEKHVRHVRKNCGPKTYA